ncbi:MAG TPA: TetR/AcrR family transcriptional regulator [Chthoniobacterales bacterium]|nr:TetR/AcrR family transcriptional regulator [Chthoniobacterales bacterium]
MPVSSLDPALERREQILRAAMICFAKRGFHQTSMHDISAEAGISVGLIYRYFENKDAVISAMAEEHKREIHEVLERARLAPSLLEAFEIIFTWDCCDNAPHVVSAFVVDLFAEAGRNPGVADLVRDVARTAMDGVTDLIARSPEANHLPYDLQPREIAEMIFAVNDGMLMRDVLTPNRTSAERRERQTQFARNLWRLLFSGKPEAVCA